MPRQTENTRRRGLGGIGLSIFLLVLGVPFVAAGMGTAYVVLRTLARHHTAQSWPEVPARILSVGLESHTSENSTTYTVTSTYEYERYGQRYVGHRVGLTSGNDNIGSWQQDTYRRLNEAHRTAQTVPCYVNPEQPQDALLVRDLRYDELAFLMIFSTIFGSFGLVVTYYGPVAWLSTRRERKLATQYPDQPWLHKLAWIDGVIRPHHLRARYRAGCIAAVYWNAVSLPVLTVIPAGLAANARGAVLPLIYPLLGLVIAAYALYLRRAVRKWGRSFVELDTFPGVIGGHVRGTLTIVGDVTEIQDLQIELKCAEYDSKGESTKIHIQYHEVQEHVALPITFGQSELRVPFDFQIPASCPQTRGMGDRRVEWDLAARAETPGVDLKLKFEMPVFVTADTDPTLGKPAGVVAAENALVQADSSPEPKRIRITQVDATTRMLELSCWPGAGLCVFFGVFFAVFATATAFMTREFIRGEWLVLILLIPFSLCTLLVPIALVAMLGKFTVTLSPGELRVGRSWGPISLTEQTVSASQITSVQYSQSASSGEKKWYAVKAKLTNGTDLKLAGMVPGILAARWVVRQVRSAIGLVETEDLAQMDTERTQR